MRSPELRPEGVAIRVLDSTGKHVTKQVIATPSPEQALEIAQALSNIGNLRVVLVRREFDVFGKMYWKD